MISFLVDLIPYFSFGLLALAILFKIYRRSISAFIAILSNAIVVNLFFYGYFDIGILVLFASLLVIFFRAMIKPENDKFIVRPYHGLEKRHNRL